MLTVGVLTGLGLWAVGIPAAASLGVLAGVLSFVPNLGPVLAALPGILLGLAEGPMTAVWAMAIYVGVQILEGNLITPMAERSAVSLPPGLIITAQLLLGLLAGPIGLLVATPLLAVVVLAVGELYVVPMETHDDDTAPVDEAVSAD
jgi:predicted PurR-regulated permease PerM